MVLPRVPFRSPLAVRDHGGAGGVERESHANAELCRGGEIEPGRQRTIPATDVAALVDGTGWAFDRHHVEPPHHAILRRTR